MRPNEKKRGIESSIRPQCLIDREKHFQFLKPDTDPLADLLKDNL